ncbi:phosphotransferase [Streptomyces sp. NPDC006798]|uniref:phosphotransferase n=1 Tax=Streptomyces sp. NPDC006798 TaxID=3155462 RepID=UPI0033C1DFB7
MFTQFVDRFGTTIHGDVVWGWRGRTLSSRVHHPQYGDCWLRLLTARADKATGKLWDGNRLAAERFDGRVHKARMFTSIERIQDGSGYLAELSQEITEPVCSAEPVLREELDPADRWWASLRTDLDTVAQSTTDRIAVRQEWIDRAVPQFLGVDPPQIRNWTVAHGDLHLANLTAQTPYLLDWEGFGHAPAGYDPALLVAYSCLSPAFVKKVRDVFSVLQGEDGRAALVVVIAELLQSASRGDHPELVPALHDLARTLI